MTNQHHADAIASLTARLLIADPDWRDDFARHFAEDFIDEMVNHGWRPFEIAPPRGTSQPADPDKVHQIIENFKRDQDAKEQA